MSIARAVEEMNLPLQCQTTEAEEKLNIRHRLLINDIQLHYPFTMNAINDFNIVSHLVYLIFLTTSSIVRLTIDNQ